MGTHTNDLLYGTTPPDSVSGDGMPVGEGTSDDTGAGFKPGQGSGDAHIVFRRTEEPETPAGSSDAFDELGNPIPRDREEDDGPISII